MPTCRTSLPIMALVLPSLLGVGCVVPQKAGRMQAPNGEYLKEKLDLGFLKEGVTQIEVTDRLRAFDVGFRSKRLFIARWAESTRWRVDSFSEAGASEDHAWRMHTLFVEFDGSALVKRFADVSDRELLNTIASWTASEPRLTLDPPILISLQGVNLTLGSHSLQFEYPKYPRHNFSLQVSDVRWLECLCVSPGRDVDLSAAGWLDLRMAFRKKMPPGRSYLLTSDLPTVITLVRFAKLAPIPLKEKSLGEKTRVRRELGSIPDGSRAGDARSSPDLSGNRKSGC